MQAEEIRSLFARASQRWRVGLQSRGVIAEPENVEKLIALVGQAPTPEPTVAPWRWITERRRQY